MDVMIDAREARVLGCLLEKEMATPEYYPLSLNALVNACNQKSNRNPVVDYSEDLVTDAIRRLVDKDLVFESRLSRVPKYEEIFMKKENLVSREASILCVLLLRGEQTAGEIRSRCERLYAFDDLDQVMDTLESLAASGYLERLPRRPGQKEDRFMHCMSGSPAATGLTAEPDDDRMSVQDNVKEAQRPEILETVQQVQELQETVENLADQLNRLREEFDLFRSQFE